VRRRHRLQLDNGLEIGGRIELETQQDTDVIDAARVDIAGPFGHFQLGQEDSARHNWAFDTAGNNEGILINSGRETAFAATSQGTFGLLRPSHSTALDFSDKAPKVTYFTPRFAGFQFALSWTPDTQTDLGNNPIGAGSVVASAGAGGSPGSLRFGTGNDEITYTNAIDIGGHYTGEIGGVGITAQAGWGTVSAPDGIDNAAQVGGIANEDSNDPNIYQAGLALTFGGFRVAGGWARIDHGMLLAGSQRTDGHSWTVGGGYGTGPWAFAVSFLHGEEEGSIARNGRDENDIF
jgi:predicted porin